MELPDVNLQLIGNIVTITSLTSLALICCLLKRDNERLNSQLRQWRRETAAQPPASAAPPAPQEPVDIRQFVARRSQTWMSAQSPNQAVQ